MKLFSKDGQTMVEATKIWVEDDKIVMQCKLMQAYSMPVILTKEELRTFTELLSWDLVKVIPDMLFEDTLGSKVYDQIKGSEEFKDSSKLFDLGMSLLKLALIDTGKN